LNGKNMSPTGKSGKPRAKPPKLAGRTQFERFVETVKAVEADESGKVFEKAMDKIVPPKPRKNPTSQTP
jgi:hypothetical protein